MQSSILRLLFLVYGVWIAGLAVAQRADFVTVTPERSYGDPYTGDMVSNGIITPLDQDMNNFYIRNADGVIEILLEADAKIGLQTRVQRGGFESGQVVCHVADQVHRFELPKVLYVRRNFQDAKAVRDYLASGAKPIFDGKLYVDPLSDHLPTEQEPWISGRFVRENGRFMDVKVGDDIYQIGTQGHDGQHRIMGLLKRTDIQPFTQQAFVHGHMEGDVFHASEVALRLLEDPAGKDDPALPRYLFIGDSISGNYDKALRAALKGHLNVYHPPTNCGPVRKGVQNIVQWLGAYDQPGMHWDVISFNFGHWDSRNTKEEYQAGLETVISELRKTRAKLVFVTTTPIPRGYPGPEDLQSDDRAPGRVQQTMSRFINPWALEVMARYPEIGICDQHALLTSEPFYATWMEAAGRADKSKSNSYGDLHIGGILSEPAGRLLARRVLDILDQEETPLADSPLTLGQLDPDRQRPATKGLDVDDFIDLLNKDERLRKYNR
ncbi:MAG: SGNH/GDSL hydrolase family protein [Rubripirellula sp.]|nr:SGNH/GDSL hydrolase family protein [Rubripirellula sp.]